MANLLHRLLSAWNARGAPPPFDAAWDRGARGRWGELIAARHYFLTRGAAIIARNWRGGGGELDLVVREGDTLVFVEVKLRDPGDPAPLAEVRDAGRTRNRTSAGVAYLRRLPRPHPAVRFDVVLVTPDPARPCSPQVDCLLDIGEGTPT